MAHLEKKVAGNEIQNSRKIKRFFKVLCKSGISSILFYSRLLFLFRFLRNKIGKQRVVILYYHRISNIQLDSLSERLLTPFEIGVPLKEFEKQVKYLSKKHRIISLDDLVSYLSKGTKIPDNSIAITFDDGYEDNFTNAYPVLRKYNAPATIFVTAGSVEHTDFLSWEQIKEMLKNGISIGAHTVSHPNLPDVADKQARWEIAHSRKLIEEKLGRAVTLFAYPKGKFNSEVRCMVEDSGYFAACSTINGAVHPGDDIYTLKRIGINPEMSGIFGRFSKSIFALKMSGVFDKIVYENP